MTLALEHVFTITAELAEPREVGRTPAGCRRVIGITGGTVDGPALRGEVLPGGADWNVVRPDGAVHVWARYELRSTAGAVVSVVNEGLAAPPDEGGTPATWWCPTGPVFEVGDPDLAWLNTGFFLGELCVGGEHRVTIGVHRVLAG